MDFKYSVELVRFKPSGKWYDTVSFGTNKDDVYQIIEEIREAIRLGVISRDYDYLFTGKCAITEEDLSFGFPHYIKAK